MEQQIVQQKTADLLKAGAASEVTNTMLFRFSPITNFYKGMEGDNTCPVCEEQKFHIKWCSPGNPDIQKGKSSLGNFPPVQGSTLILTPPEMLLTWGHRWILVKCITCKIKMLFENFDDEQSGAHLAFALDIKEFFL